MRHHRDPHATRKLPPAVRPATAARLEAMLALCRRVLRTLPEGPVFGVDLRAVCGDARDVRARPLSDDDKVRIGHDTVEVELACFEAIAAGPGDIATCARVGALYLVHELAHWPQGIGEYATVRRLRALDESAVLQLDLAADHVAALVVRAVSPEAGLLELKELQGQSLCGYPAGTDHAPAARHRKARRMASLRADVCARRAGLARDGFVVAWFAPSANHVALTEEGDGATRLLALAPLDVADLDVLCAAADPGAEIAAVDHILGGVLAGADREPLRRGGARA
jgi:hypothetical protein